MPKKKRKNRPRKRPSRRPSHRRAPKRQKEAVVDHTRRKIVVGGIAAAILGVVGYSILSGDKTPEKPTQKSIPSTPKEPEAKPRIPEYNEWAAKIELPQIKLEPSPVDWNLEKRTEYFIPKIANQGSEVYRPLKQFYKLFDANLHRLFSRMGDMKDVDSRMKEIKAFETFLAINYRNATSAGPNLTTCDLNRFLIPHKRWMKFSTPYNANAAFFDVEKIHMAQIQNDGKTESLPVVFLANQRDAIVDSAHPEARIDGLYLPKCGYIAVDKDGLQKSSDEVVNELESELRKLSLDMIPIDRQTFPKDAVNMGLVHEGAHASLHRINKIDPKGSHAIKQKGTISMGSYEIFEEEYFKSSNLQVHELIALGTGMASSKNTAFIAVWSAAGTSGIPNGYDLARYVFVLEIIHSPHISENFRRKLIVDLERENVVRHDNIIRAFSEIPPEGFQDIGERVAKLGIYLTQRD